MSIKCRMYLIPKLGGFGHVTNNTFSFFKTFSFRSHPGCQFPSRHTQATLSPIHEFQVFLGEFPWLTWESGTIGTLTDKWQKEETGSTVGSYAPQWDFFLGNFHLSEDQRSYNPNGAQWHCG